MTASVVAPDEVIHIRYARKASPVDLRGHLLTDTWTETRGTRPAVCGVRAQPRSWRAVERLTDSDRYLPCPDCTTAAGLDQPSTAPVRIGGDGAPTAGRRVELPASARVDPSVNSHAARAERRRGFLADVVVLSRDARAYRPRFASDDFRPSWLYPRHDTDDQQ